MSRKSSQDKNIDQDNLLSYSVSYFTSQSLKLNENQDIRSASQSYLIDSSSHDVFESLSNKKKKKTNKIKSKQINQNMPKNKIKSKIITKISILSKKLKDQKTNTTLNKDETNQKPKKTQLTLNKFLGKRSQDEELNEQDNVQKENQTIVTYSLYPYEANYISKCELFKGYSLQKVDDFQKPYRSRIALKQRKLSRYFKYQRKRTCQSEQIQEIRVYSRSYVAIKTILREMLESQKVHNFFKESIDNVISCQSQLKYYEKYKEVIDSPLDLQSLEEMVDEGGIKNLLEFNALFNQMIVNSVTFHTYMNNHEMVQSSIQLHCMYEKMMIQLSCPHMNEIEKSAIKTTAFLQKPKSKKVSVEGENKEVEFMDMNDLVNKNRIKVMNHFLKQLSQKYPENIYTFINRIKNLIHRYPNDRVEVIRQSVNQKKKQRQFSFSSSKQNMSQKSNYQQSSQQQNDQIYQISVSCISVSLFQQVKELIKSELRQMKKHKNMGEQSEQILRNILYPHDDSDDFDSMNDSDET